jgi:hypothetical protein
MFHLKVHQDDTIGLLLGLSIVVLAVIVAAYAYILSQP